MKGKTFYTLIGLFFIGISLFAQNFNIEDQYKQAMTNAKLAFEAKEYSTAVMFYREAIKIKPDALLPKYKVEDIKTIYIEKELKKDLNPDTAKLAKKERRKVKKVEAVEAKKEAELVATLKMNEEADKAEAELKNLNVGVVQINELADDLNFDTTDSIDPLLNDQDATVEIKATKIYETDDDFKIDNSIQIATVEKNKKAELNVKATTIKEHEDDLIIDDFMLVERVETDKKAAVKVRVVNINEQSENIQEDMVVGEIVKQKKIPEVEKMKLAPKQVKNYTEIQAKPEQMTTEEKKVWVENERKRLANIYPNKKTIEEIDKPGKHIMRVIMNINSDVSIYLKVKHSWGATFYFIDEVGQELRSINQQYFNLMTNLKTYGD